ncbi:unnamed protein product, partial [Prorocentrum cordatum]
MKEEEEEEESGWLSSRRGPRPRHPMESSSSSSCRGAGAADAGDRLAAVMAPRGAPRRWPTRGRTDQEAEPPSGRRKRRKRGKRKNRKPRLRVVPMLHDEASLEEQPLLSGGGAGPLALSRAQFGWEPVLHDEVRRSFVSIRRGAFPEQVLAGWWAQCQAGIEWVQASRQCPGGVERPLPRRAAWLTTSGCRCSYEYSGTAWEPIEMEGWFLEISEAVFRECGVVERPNSCNANMYDSGLQVVGWHCDDEPLFNATGQDALIISLSGPAIVRAVRERRRREEGARLAAERRHLHDGRPDAPQRPRRHIGVDFDDGGGSPYTGLWRSTLGAHQRARRSSRTTTAGRWLPTSSGRRRPCRTGPAGPSTRCPPRPGGAPRAERSGFRRRHAWAHEPRFWGAGAAAVDGARQSAQPVARVRREHVFNRRASGSRCASPIASGC